MTYRIEFDDDEFKDMQKDVLKAIYVLRKAAYESDSPDLNGICMESSILLKMVWDKISTLKSQDEVRKMTCGVTGSTLGSNPRDVGPNPTESAIEETTT